MIIPLVNGGNVNSDKTVSEKLISDEGKSKIIPCIEMNSS